MCRGRTKMKEWVSCKMTKKEKEEKDNKTTSLALKLCRVQHFYYYQSYRKFPTPTCPH